MPSHFVKKGKAFETNTSSDSEFSIKAFLKLGTKKTSLAWFISRNILIQI